MPNIIDRATATQRRIRKRRAQDGSSARTHCVRIRMTATTSNQLASLQGLCWRYGKRETLAALFENVLMPALREHVKPYADRARGEREADKRARADALCRDCSRTGVRHETN